MHIYFAGIGGVGIGPLAALASEAGYDVSGYDIAPSSMTDELQEKGIDAQIGDGLQLLAAAHQRHPVDWLVATAALSPHDPVLEFARFKGIHISKRDELINRILTDKHQQLIAISGTHGKTTTTAMVAWIFAQFEIPASHSIGTRMSFAPSGTFNPKGRFFIYEADEYDRNMLQFHPQLSLITSLDYDHPDVYPTRDDYKQAFEQFIMQSEQIIIWQKDAGYLGLRPTKKITVADSLLAEEARVTLPGAHTRRNALLAAGAFASLFPEFKLENILSAINRFPGTQRRFERLSENLYTDYAHHPAEIAAGIQMALELNPKVTVVYQPHQNVRQHEMKNQYDDCFAGARHVYWLPTYLSREDPQLPVLTPKLLISGLADPSVAEPAKLDEQLIQSVRREIGHGSLVLFMGAGDIDSWLRRHLHDIVD